MYNRLTLVDGLTHKEAVAKIHNDHSHLDGFTERNIRRYLPADNPNLPRRVRTSCPKNSITVRSIKKPFSDAAEQEVKSASGEEDSNHKVDNMQTSVNIKARCGSDQAEHDIDDILQDTQHAANDKQMAENETENLTNQVQEESKETAERQIIEFDFSIPFEDLRSVMEELFMMTKGFGKVLFHGTLNMINGKVTVIFHENNHGESFGCEGKGTILKSNTSGFDIIQ